MESTETAQVDRRTITRNAVSLYAVQFANYFFPLLTVPYVVRVLGPVHYGEIAFALSIITYVTLLVDYGFSLSATRRVAQFRGDTIQLQRIASSVWGAKALLGLIGLAVLLSIILLAPRLRGITELLVLLYGVVIGHILFPRWLFQGMERMFYVPLIDVTIQTIVTAGIFLLVHRSEDLMIYAGLIASGSLAAGLIGAISAFRVFRLRLLLPHPADIREALKEGWTLFLSSASVSLYTAGNVLLLGLLTNYRIVGIFAAAEKIVRACVGLLDPLAQAMYPRFSRIAVQAHAAALEWGRKLWYLMGFIGLVLSMCLFVLAPFAVELLLGHEFVRAIPVVRVLALLPVLIAASNVLGVQVMIPFGKDRQFTMILLLGGLVNLTLAILLVPAWEEMGMALAVVMSEVFVTCAMYIYVRTKVLPRSGQGSPTGTLTPSIMKG